jgi:tRNA A37 threonylcarbamoyltransferase TsaD
MKSLVHQLISKQEKTLEPFSQNQISNIAYSFQEAVVDTLISKVLDAAEHFDVQTISLV